MATAHAEEHAALGGRLWTLPFAVLVALAASGMAVVAYRFWAGIGAVSNLSDGYPLGIWIAYDVATGTALACGGYALAFAVYVGNGFRYHGLMRSALLTGLFGYGLAGFSVLVDLGRYWNLPNLFLHPNPNSVLLEIALCVMSYCVVLGVEFLPAVCEGAPDTAWGRRLRRLGRALERVLLPVIVLGMTLPTMHQSSLGSLFLIAGTKLHPFWHTPLLPLLFLVNAVLMGYAVVVFESVTSSYAFGRPYETEPLAGLGRIAAGAAWAWTLIRAADLAWRAPWAGAGWSMAGWVAAELALTALPAAALLAERVRRSPRWLFVTAASLLLGGGLYRMDVYLVGFDPGGGWRYFPSLAEVWITVGIVALELAGYLFFVKRFPVLPVHRGPAVAEPVLERRAA
ncbi:MAG: Ni/Fe-hydrogenase cytochrome b subunit [Candidatus Dadabacteria bacterium]|nr:MAG: Ni/Fe-hydrogenase cytochrome b subunit [Candidatus Dadabacteria bacterium]